MMKLFGISYEGYDDVMVLPHRTCRCLLLNICLSVETVYGVCVPSGMSMSRLDAAEVIN